jgi:S-adenosyl methyltransferase
MRDTGHCRLPDVGGAVGRHGTTPPFLSVMGHVHLPGCRSLGAVIRRCPDVRACPRVPSSLGDEVAQKIGVVMSQLRRGAMEAGFPLSEIDTTRPHPARMYDAYLGGKDNYAADREAVRQILRTWPEVRAMARANRAAMQRMVRFLAGEAGIRQFLDIGTGIPSAGNVHEVAGQVAPGSRVVYVDNDHSKSGCAHERCA